MYSASNVESEINDSFKDRRTTGDSLSFTLIGTLKRTPESDFQSF